VRGLTDRAIKRATIVGGSLTGLAAGILLRKIGWGVDIFERSPQSLSDRGAGIVMQQETLELLRLCGTKDDGDVGVMLTYRQYLDASGAVVSSDRMPQLMTSWGLLYSWFERSFPADNYHLGHEFESMWQGSSSVTSRFKGGMETKADLLVAADGFRSSIRGLLLPEIQPRYAGYVAWRGVVPERELSPDILKVFEDNFTFFKMAESHILCYLIPSETGDTGVGQRRLNWVWYWNLTEAELDPLLTDANGVRRAYAIPPGALHPEQENKQRTIAERVLPPAFKELLRATREPFVQAIMDLACPQLVFNRTILMGDASFVIRPHTAASTSKGIANAFALVGELAAEQELSESLDQWQRSELNRGRRLMSYGQGLGRSQGR
jgi:2-polyprenyl-6-methoxyphenol hydroxylase-like FAD-dependent oxidoreductase